MFSTVFIGASFIIKNPIIPITITDIPIIENIIVQLFEIERSKDINPPNTARIAISGIIAFIPSAAPRLLLSVESVSHALKQASFADEPKNVITQSIIITKVMHIAETDTAVGKIAPTISVLINAKERIEIPHKI